MTYGEPKKRVSGTHPLNTSWPNYNAWVLDIVRQTIDRRSRYARDFIPGTLRRGKKVDRVKARLLPAGQHHRLRFPL